MLNKAKFDVSLPFVFCSFLFLCLLLIGCSKQQTTQENYLITEDNISIAFDFYESNSTSALLLIHQLGKNKDSWKEFAEKNKHNFKILAIDLRGHGESGLLLKNFEQKDFENMIYDIDAAVSFLENKNISSLQILGASIGANLALKFAANNPSRVNSIVLFSPGLEYRGVNIEKEIKLYSKPLLIITSQSDSYSYQSSEKLARNSVSKELEYKIFPGSKHGTDIFSIEGCEQILDQWLQEHK